MDVPLPNVEAMTGPTPPKQGRISNKVKLKRLVATRTIRN